MLNYIYEQYAASGAYRFIVIQKSETVFQVIVQKRYDDSEWLGSSEPHYADVKSAVHYADTREKAIAIGNEELRCLSGA